MKYFLSELRIVPRIVWPIALLISGGMTLMFFLMPRGPKMSRVETAFVLWGMLFLFAWVVLIGYINADARQRGMRYIMWTLLTIFIPYGIGAILYFVLRDPMLVSCPKCGARGRSLFVFCPQCGEGLSPSCPACKRAVEPGWNRCAYCGKELEQLEPIVHSR
jgi:hypothetical protein